MTNDKKELRELIAEIPSNKQALAEEMLEELMFMFKTAKELRRQVEAHGAIIQFVQGKQKMPVQNPALKAYNDLMPKYNTLIKNFIALIPDTVDLNKTPAQSPLDQFEREIREYIEENYQSD